MRTIHRTNSKSKPSSIDELIEEIVEAKLAQKLAALRMTPAGDDWVDVAEELPSRKRQLYAACRDGELAGRKVARRWLVRRVHLDRWIEGHTAKPEPVAADAGVSYVDAARARLGLRRVG